jgi:omega-amidase
MNLSLTSIQCSLHWENRKANLGMFETKISNIEDTDIIVLPEMFSTGFSMQPELHFDTMEGETIAWMKEQSFNKNAAICGSIIIKNEEGQFVNRFLFVCKDEIQYYDKAHLFRMGEENQHYIKGQSQKIIHFKGFNIAPMVCYDLRFPAWIRRTANFEYDLLLFVANWPQRRSEHWKTLLLARAIENQAYVLGVNRIGNDGNGIYHSGDTSFINPLGEILYRKTEDEDIHTHVIEKSIINDYRIAFPVEKDADEFELK